MSLFTLIRLHTIKGRALRQQDSWWRFYIGAVMSEKMLQCPHIIITCSNFGVCGHDIILDPTHSNVCRCHSYLLLSQCFVERIMPCVENALNIVYSSNDGKIIHLYVNPSSLSRSHRRRRGRRPWCAEWPDLSHESTRISRSVYTIIHSDSVLRTVQIIANCTGAVCPQTCRY